MIDISKRYYINLYDSYTTDCINESFFQKARNIDELKELVKEALKLGCTKKGIIIMLLGLGLSMPVINSVVSVAGDKDNTETVEEKPSKNNVETKKANDPLAKFRAKSFEASKKGLDHIKEYEAYRDMPYLATKNETKYTIGYGHVMSNEEYNTWVNNGKKPISKQEADRLFKNDVDNTTKYLLAAMRDSLPSYLQKPELYTQGDVDAIISMVYNMGIGNFTKSNMFKTWKNCSIDKETGLIKKLDWEWVQSMIKKTGITQTRTVSKTIKLPNGKNEVKKEKISEELPGLVKRRQTEYNMAYKQDYTRV